MIWRLTARLPGKPSAPTEGKPRVLEASSTAGPYSTMVSSKPLRCSRVEVIRLTSETEPSNGTEWMKTVAFWPGSAWMSGKTFSLVSYSTSPSAPA